MSLTQQIHKIVILIHVKLTSQFVPASAPPTLRLQANPRLGAPLLLVPTYFLQVEFQLSVDYSQYYGMLSILLVLFKKIS